MANVRLLRVPGETLGIDPFLIHEIVHAAMPTPPLRCKELQSWMSGVEEVVAREWGIHEEWEYQLRGVSTDWRFLPTRPRHLDPRLRNYTATQSWGSLNKHAQTLWKEAWRELAEKAGVLRGRRVRLPSHDDQLSEETTPVPRGLHWALSYSQESRGWVGYHKGKQVLVGSLREFRSL